MTTDLPTSCISSGIIFPLLADIGVTESQFKSWRNAGLLPTAIQQSDARTGSVVYFQLVTPAQAQAVKRLLSNTRTYEFARRVLWAAGYDIDSKYWRSDVAAADMQLTKAMKLTSAFAFSREPKKLASEHLESLTTLSGLLVKVRDRLQKCQFASLINDAANIAAGDFEHFQPPISDGDDNPRDAWLNALDMGASKKDSVQGERLHFWHAIPSVFKDISQSFSVGRGVDLEDREILAARNDVRNALKIAICVYHASAWLYGPTAFGLRMAAHFGASFDYNWFLRLSILFARLRRTSASFETSAEIAQLASSAEQTWLMSIAFREILNHPKLLGKFPKKHLKDCFSDSLQMKKLLKYLEGCGAPMPNISPWHQWNNLSKTKKMPFGLLAMSIGSSDKLDLASIVQSANANAVR